MKDRTNAQTTSLRELSRILKYYEHRTSRVLEKHFDKGIEHYLVKRLLEPALKLSRIIYDPGHNKRECIRVIDIGTGIGWPLYLLPKYIVGCVYVVGIDLSESLVKAGRNIFFKNPMLSILTEYVIGDMFNIPLRGKGFDAVVAFGAFEYVSKDQIVSLLKEIKALCRGNCSIIYTVRSSSHFWKAKITKHEISVKKYSIDEVEHITSLAGLNPIAVYTTLHLNISVIWKVYRTLRQKFGGCIAKLYSRLVIALEGIVALIAPKKGYTVVIIATPSQNQNFN